MLSFKTHAFCLSLAPKHQDTPLSGSFKSFSSEEAEELFASGIKLATVGRRQWKVIIAFDLRGDTRS